MYCEYMYIYVDADGVVTGVSCGPYTSGFIVTSTNSVSYRSTLYNSICAVNHTVYMCGLNASGQCGQGPPSSSAGDKDASAGPGSSKIVVRPTLIAMPVFDFFADADLMKYRSSSSSGGGGSSGSRLLSFNMRFGSSSKSRAPDKAPFCDSVRLVLGMCVCVLHACRHLCIYKYICV